MANIYILQTDQNILNIIAIRYYKIKNVVILKNPDFEANYAENGLKNYLKNEHYTINELYFNPNEKSDTTRLKSHLKHNDVFVIPGGGYAYSLNMYNGLKDACKLCFVEEDGDIYEFDGSLFKEVKADDVALDVEDYIENFGGTINQSSEDFFNEPTAVTLFNLINNHIDAYHKMMRPIPLKSHYYDKNKAYIDLSLFRDKPDALDLLRKILQILSQSNLCHFSNKHNQYLLKFNDRDYKEIFAKAGTWLEAITYHALSDLSQIASSKSSVQFFWKSGYGKVINEIDVMGVYDNKLILISCKDTEKLSETTLYELFTHGEQLGFDSIIKILVTTGVPMTGFSNRAEDLNVNIIEYDGVIENLKAALSKIIF